MREIYRLQNEQVMTPDLLDKLIRYFGAEQLRRRKMFDYYEGHHAICHRSFSDASKPNNRVISPFPHNITDFATGYFTGSPIKYENINGTVEDILRYNDDTAVNTEISKNCSICGYGYELQYVDKYGELRYVSIDPRECFMVYDTALDAEALYFIRYYKQHDIATNKDIEYAEVNGRYDYLKYSRTSGVFELIESRPHGFDEVPCTEYLNNPEALGDFETCISLIDAYDILMSNSVNDSTEFSDAYLILSNMMGTEPDDVAAMREKRVLLIDKDAEARWLTKDINSTYAEDMKNRLSNEIHKFSNVPDMTDVNFASNASGVAMKYKLLGLEDITAKKEMEYRRGLTRRFEIMSAYLMKIGVGLNWRDISYIFTRNLPINMIDIADMISKVGHLLSKETQLSMLPLDIDIDEEIKRKEEEDAAGFDTGWHDPLNPDSYIK